jgi:hypothetical protein
MALRTFGGAFSPPKDTQTVRLVEFETPACPLAWFSSIPKNKTLAEFQRAHLDLFSVLGNLPMLAGQGTQSPLPGVSLFIRPIGGDATNERLTELSLTVELLPNEVESPPTNTIVLALEPSKTPMFGIMLVIRKSDTDISVSGRAFYVGGEVKNVKIKPQSLSARHTTLEAVELISVSVKTDSGAPAEFWTDVSLLTLPKGTDDDDPAHFTFDWFFTGGETQSPADAITEAALREMVEAQARIIAVSPLIAVED